MGKNPAYLPGCAWTVGGMIDAQLHVTWGCAKCRRSGTVSLQQVAQARGIDYCMVDRRSTCEADEENGPASVQAPTKVPKLDVSRCEVHVLKFQVHQVGVPGFRCVGRMA